MWGRTSSGELQSALLQAALTLRTTAEIAQRCARTARHCRSEEIARQCEQLAREAARRAEQLARFAGTSTVLELYSTVGCSPGESQRQLELIAQETAALLV